MKKIMFLSALLIVVTTTSTANASGFLFGAIMESKLGMGRGAGGFPYQGPYVNSFPGIKTLLTGPGYTEPITKKIVPRSKMVQKNVKIR
ncbi:MAG: hypothetical protein HYV68_01040 [Candidatus Taylorbacteria bacterium]|nr:hypothetical protein [Candidatus Taylorbacteria bacterium]